MRERAKLTDEEALALVARLGYHPLTVELAAAQLARGRHTWESLLQPLRTQQPGSLDALSLDKDDRLASLQICFDLSVGALDIDLARAYRQLGVLAPDAPFGAEDAAALWQITPAAALATRITLSPGSAELVSKPHPISFRMHLLLRDDALARLRRHDELDAALHRHVDHYVDMANKRDRHFIARSHN